MLALPDTKSPSKARCLNKVALVQGGAGGPRPQVMKHVLLTGLLLLCGMCTKAGGAVGHVHQERRLGEAGEQAHDQEGQSWGTG